MLHFRKIFITSKHFHFHSVRSFSNVKASNPYYILGVEKDMKFEEIKKHYYKLAHEYHPDINKSPDAAKQFVTIKEAFETIKKLHGKAVKMDFEGGARGARSDFTSVRPNAEQYTDDFDKDQDYENESRDYKEWAYKASQNAEHSQFADSFETIHDIRDIKFRPSDVDVPDASRRFGLDKNRGKISKFSDNSGFYVVFIVGVFLMLFAYINKTENKILEEQLDNTVYNLKNKDEYKQFSLDEKENTVKQIAMDMKAHKEYAEFTAKVEGAKAYEKTIRTRFVPEAQPFVSFSSN